MKKIFLLLIATLVCAALITGMVMLQVRRVAEQEIYKAAISDGILVQARLNAENYLTRLLHDLGFKDVIFINATPTPGEN